MNEEGLKYFVDSDVFLSWRHNDGDYVDVLLDSPLFIQADQDKDDSKISLWYSDGHEGIGGKLDNLFKQIEHVKTLIVLLTEQSINSEWVRKEFEEAINKLGENYVGIINVGDVKPGGQFQKEHVIWKFEQRFITIEKTEKDTKEVLLNRLKEKTGEIAKAIQSMLRTRLLAERFMSSYSLNVRHFYNTRAKINDLDKNYTSLYMERSLQNRDDKTVLNEKDFIDDNNHALIYASGGMGKTEYIKNLTNRINFLKESGDFRAAIYIKCKQASDYFNENSSKEMIDYLTFYLARKGDTGFRSFTVSTIDGLLASTRVTLFFDALDEVFSSARTSLLIEKIDDFIRCTNQKNGKYKKCKVVVTSRGFSNEFTSITNRFSLLGFEKNKWEEYCDKTYDLITPYSVKDSISLEKFKEGIANIDKEILENPLFITQLLFIYKIEGVIPQTKVQILDKTASYIIKNDKDKIDENYYPNLPKDKSIFDSLKYISYRLLYGDDEIETILSDYFLSYDPVEKDNYVDALLDYLSKRSILVNESGKYSIVYHIFTDYFAMMYLHDSMIKRIEDGYMIKNFDKRNKVYGLPQFKPAINLLISKFDTELDDNSFMEVITKICHECGGELDTLFEVDALLNHQALYRYILSKYLLEKTLNKEFGYYNEIFYYCSKYNLFDEMLLIGKELLLNPNHKNDIYLLSLIRDLFYILEDYLNIYEFTFDKDIVKVYQEAAEATKESYRGALNALFYNVKIDINNYIDDDNSKIHPFFWNLKCVQRGRDEKRMGEEELTNVFIDELGMYVDDYRDKENYVGLLFTKIIEEDFERLVEFPSNLSYQNTKKIVVITASNYSLFSDYYDYYSKGLLLPIASICKTNVASLVFDSINSRSFLLLFGNGYKNVRLNFEFDHLGEEELSFGLTTVKEIHGSKDRWWWIKSDEQTIYTSFETNGYHYEGHDSDSLYLPDKIRYRHILFRWCTFHHPKRDIDKVYHKSTLLHSDPSLRDIELLFEAINNLVKACNDHDDVYLKLDYFLNNPHVLRDSELHSLMHGLTQTDVNNIRFMYDDARVILYEFNNKYEAYLIPNICFIDKTLNIGNFYGANNIYCNFDLGEIHLTFNDRTNPKIRYISKEGGWKAYSFIKNSNNFNYKTFTFYYEEDFENAALYQNEDCWVYGPYEELWPRRSKKKIALLKLISVDESLEEIIIPSYEEVLDSEILDKYNILYAIDVTFNDNNNIKTLIVPAGVRHISFNDFGKLKHLEYLSLPNTLTYIVPTFLTQLKKKIYLDMENPYSINTVMLNAYDDGVVREIYNNIQNSSIYDDNYYLSYRGNRYHSLLLIGTNYIVHVNENTVHIDYDSRPYKVIFERKQIDKTLRDLLYDAIVFGEVPEIVVNDVSIMSESKFAKLSIESKASYVHTPKDQDNYCIVDNMFLDIENGRLIRWLGDNDRVVIPSTITCADQLITIKAFHSNAFDNFDNYNYLELPETLDKINISDRLVRIKTLVIKGSPKIVDVHYCCIYNFVLSDAFIDFLNSDDYDDWFSNNCCDTKSIKRHYQGKANKDFAKERIKLLSKKERIKESATYHRYRYFEYAKIYFISNINKEIKGIKQYHENIYLEKDGYVFTENDNCFYVTSKISEAFLHIIEISANKDGLVAFPKGQYLRIKIDHINVVNNYLDTLNLNNVTVEYISLGNSKLDDNELYIKSLYVNVGTRIWNGLSLKADTIYYGEETLNGFVKILKLTSKDFFFKNEQGNWVTIKDVALNANAREEYNYISSIETINMDEKVEIIDDSFNDIYCLKTISFNENIKRINSSFNNLSTISNVIFPSGIEHIILSFNRTTITSLDFSECDSLVIEDSFVECDCLEKISFSKSNRTIIIGRSFGLCKRLKVIVAPEHLIQSLPIDISEFTKKDLGDGLFELTKKE